MIVGRVAPGDRKDSRSWVVLKAGVIGTSTFLVLGGVLAAFSKADPAAAPSWLDVATGWLALGFGVSAIVTWVAAMVDCARRSDLAPVRRAGVFALLFIGNFVGATLYYLLMPPRAAGE